MALKNTTKNIIFFFNRHKRFSFLSAYTGLFAICATAAFFWFSYMNKSMAWNAQSHDGVDQHFTALRFYADYLQNIIRDFLAGKGLSFPQFDFRLGFGGDILTTLNYYAIGDPLNLTAAFVPDRYIETLYAALVITRLYLSGLAFSYYCKLKRRNTLNTLIGALIYAFCGFALFASVRHPFFINPMIYLPFMLAGVEKIISGKKPYLLVASVFIALISNFYFFFMLTVAFAVYTAAKLIRTRLFRKPKETFKIILKIAASYATGILLSSFIFLPVLFAFTQSGRSGGVGDIPGFFYPGFYYPLTAAKFIWADADSSNWTLLQYPAISLFSCILLFLKKQTAEKWIKPTLFIMLMFLVFPIFGSALNGFAYISNRWAFALSFVVAYTTTFMLPAFKKITRRQIAVLTGVLIFYLVLFACTVLFFNRKIMPTAASAVLLLISFAVVMVFRNRKTKKSRRLFNTAVLILVITSIAVNAFFRFSPEYGRYITEFHKKGIAVNTSISPASAAAKIDDDSFYRVDTSNIMYSNSSLLYNYLGASYFFSLLDGRVSDTYCELGLPTIPSQCHFIGHDGRATLSSLFGVKYTVSTKNKQKINVPPGSEKLFTASGGDVYGYKYNLPFGFTYSGYMLKKDYDRLPALDKQQAMLSCAILENTPQNKEAEARYTSSVRKLPFSVECQGDITFNDNTINIKNKNAKLIIRPEKAYNSEIYLDMLMDSFTPLNKHTDHLKITFTCGKKTRLFLYKMENSTTYNGQKLFVNNGGYYKETPEKIELKFNSEGILRLKSIGVSSIPSDGFADSINALREETMTDLSFETDRITGKINVTQDKLLLLYIPYSKGWSAKVDGKETELLAANGFFSALDLKDGNHTIELTYKTPYSALGWTVSASTLSLILIAATVKLFRKKMLT